MSEFDLIDCLKCGRCTECICNKTYEDAEEEIDKLKAENDRLHQQLTIYNEYTEEFVSDIKSAYEDNPDYTSELEKIEWEHSDTYEDTLRRIACLRKALVEADNEQ